MIVSSPPFPNGGVTPVVVFDIYTGSWHAFTDVLEDVRFPPKFERTWPSQIFPSQVVLGTVLL